MKTTMTLDDYQNKIIPFDTFDKDKWDGNLTRPAFVEKVLGLAGEAGEVEDKIKKVLRDDNAELTPEKKDEVLKELGDTLWYIATIARYLDTSLGDIASQNVEKLQSRLDRNALSGSGDNR